MSVAALKQSGLFGLAQQMGAELAGVHGHALRRSISLPPNKNYLTGAGGNEAHSCGEVLVAAVLNTFVSIWVKRLQHLGDESKLDRARAAEEGAELADHLLNVCIRAIDYCPPTDIEFGDFASALLTVDAELNPQDSKYRLRSQLLAAFADYGIEPSSPGQPGRQPGSWNPPPLQIPFVYDRTHFESLRSDPDELFRFLWENRDAFRLHNEAHTRVLSVRPCVRAQCRRRPLRSSRQAGKELADGARPPPQSHPPQGATSRGALVYQPITPNLCGRAPRPRGQRSRPAVDCLLKPFRFPPLPQNTARPCSMSKSTRRPGS